MCPVAEGLAAALEVLDEMETLRAKRCVFLRIYGTHILSRYLCACMYVADHLEVGIEHFNSLYVFFVFFLLWAVIGIQHYPLVVFGLQCAVACTNGIQHTKQLVKGIACQNYTVYPHCLLHLPCSYHGAISKHCVLIANRDPDDRPVQESDTYHKFSLSDLAEKFVEVSSGINIHTYVRTYIDSSSVCQCVEFCPPV